MFPIHTFTTILALLCFSVQAIPLAQREVVAPPILQPNSSSVWIIGSQETVIWDTSSLPPFSQITNPTAQIILGFNESNSLNLDLNNPLAQGFNITDGNVTFTVPNVPPRNDYIVVLIGDSGDASPAFAITAISPPPASTDNSSSAVPSGPSLTFSPTSLTLVGSETTSPLTTGTPTNADTTTAPLPNETNPTAATTPTTGPSGTSGPSSSSGASGTSSPSSGSSTSASAAVLASTSTSDAGWSLHHGSSTWGSAVPILMSVAPSVMFFIL